MVEVIAVIGTFFLAWVGSAVLAHRKGYSKVVGIGGGFIVGVLCFALAAFAVLPARQGANTQADPLAEGLSIEQQLIVVSTGRFPDAADKEVARVRALLTEASVKFGNSTSAVADQAYMTQKIAQKEGVQISAMEVLEAVALSYVKDSGANFASQAAMYLTLRKSGMSHAQAILSTKGIAGRITDLGNASSR